MAKIEIISGGGRNKIYRQIAVVNGIGDKDKKIFNFKFRKTSGRFSIESKI